MKMWLKILSVVLVIVIAASAILLLNQEEKECCLCSSFRYHAPCLIDLETGELIELDLYFPHPTLVAEISDFQPEQGTFSFVRLGNVSGTKLTDSKIIEIHIPNESTYNPALCSDCKKQLPFGHTSRYILADLYSKEEKVLMPIKADTTFTLRCALVHFILSAIVIIGQRITVYPFGHCPFDTVNDQGFIALGFQHTDNLIFILQQHLQQSPNL